jgi:uncharacterized damage-inducible protein DinB
MNAIPNPVADYQAENETLLTLLTSSRDRFLASFADLTEQQAQLHPEEGRWSVLQTVEHLTMAETTMMRLLDQPRRPRPASAANREQAFLMAGADRTRKLQSPDGGRPTGRFATLAEARAKFSSIRASAIEFVEQNREDLRAFEVTHPHPAAGTVSIYELLILIARHADRHALQIAEIRNSAAFAAAGKS